MNTYDLADRLEQLYLGTHIQKAAEVLRQQADRIAELEKEIKVSYAWNTTLLRKAQEK